MNYALNEEKMFADVTDGVAIIINSETGIYYGLNALGTVVYENLVNGASTEEILSALKSIAGAPADIEAKLDSFIKTMLNNELIIEAEISSASVNIDENIAKEDAFELKCEEYNDAQELLLADPIHEVKEESGWTPEKDSIGYTKEETAEREKKIEEDK
ncbi:MAG: PqqD family protein [Candidatus Gastranaerophilaceae bacterium]